jgi:hypothetical protein
MARGAGLALAAQKHETNPPCFVFEYHFRSQAASFDLNAEKERNPGKT